MSERYGRTRPSGRRSTCYPSPPPPPSRTGSSGWGAGVALQGMAQVNTAIAQRVLTYDDRTGYTLLVDPTIIAAEKREAEMTYLGVTGYRPVLATLQELGLVIAYEFKEGNDNGGRVEILRQAFQNLPSGKRIETVLVDAEYYTDDVMTYLTGQGVRWAMGADKGAAVKAAITVLPEEAWRPLKTQEGMTTDREVAETV
ncbi:MAG: transposase, partial [candidate division NC10 bacterium]|nr:transposase [candidate division NC10 bacterium]